MTPYPRWLENVDKAISRLTDGAIPSHYDLPDLTDLWELYDAEYTPTEAAEQVLEDNGFWEFLAGDDFLDPNED